MTAITVTEQRARKLASELARFTLFGSWRSWSHNRV